MERSRTWHFRAIEAKVANSTALRFSTGRAPGNPRHTGQILVFGSSPNFGEQLQKAFVSVSSCKWTSRPITGSYFARTSGETLTIAAIRGYDSNNLLEQNS